MHRFFKGNSRLETKSLGKMTNKKGSSGMFRDGG